MIQDAPILQSKLMDPPWSLPRGTHLPGISPITKDDWVRQDDAFAGQMRLRDQLIANRPRDVLALTSGADAAAEELLNMVLAILSKTPGYTVNTTDVTRPNGLKVNLGDPLPTLGRLVQEDFCLMQQRGRHHALTGAVLCFPASWSLREKIGRPLMGIHEPVDIYDENIGKRVQRLFDAIQPDRPLVRANCLAYSDFALFQPRRESDRRVKPTGAPAYIRAERQCLIRLPETGAVAFSIHTSIVRRADLPASDLADIERFLQLHTTY